MKYNKPLKAVLLSIIAGIPGGVFSTAMKYLHLTDISALEAISMMYIPQGSMYLGFLATVGFGAIIGLVVYYSAMILGTDYFPVKSMIIIMFAESIVFIVFGTLAKNEYLIQDTLGNYVHATSAALSGLFSGYLYKKYLFTKKQH